MNPIFIIGTERSGTNLLRLMLNMHPNIFVPHPPHIMKFFHPIVHRYGDLKKDKNFKKLIADICRMVELHSYQWDIKPDREKVFANARDRNLISIYFEIYNQYLQFTGKTRWACKSTFMIEHVPEILNYYRDAKFIYMVRDGRDVAVSSKSSIFNHFNVYYIAKLWKEEQETGLHLLDKLSSDQIMLLKYEDLITEPKSMIQKVCTFLNEPFEEKMLQYHKSSEAAKSGSLSISWGNTSKPVISDNKEKFRTSLSNKEIKLFEAITCIQMDRLGYKLSYPLADLMLINENMMKPKLSYWLSEKFLYLKAEMKHISSDRNSKMRLKKMWYMRYISCIRRLS